MWGAVPGSRSRIEEVVMKFLRITLPIIALVFLALGCSNEPATPDDEGTLNITMDDVKFTPDEIDLNVGTPVRVVLNNRSETNDFGFMIGTGVLSEGGFGKDFFDGVKVKVIGPAKLVVAGGAILTREGDGAVEETNGGGVFMVLKGPSSESTVIEFIVPDKWEDDWEFASFEDDGNRFEDGMRGVLRVFPCKRAGGAWGQKNEC